MKLILKVLVLIHSLIPHLFSKHIGLEILVPEGDKCTKSV